MAVGEAEFLAIAVVAPVLRFSQFKSSASHGAVVCSQQRSLQHVAQLADVAGKTVIRKGAVTSSDFNAGFAAVFLASWPSNNSTGPEFPRGVSAAAAAQWRTRRAIKQILPEPPGLRFISEILVCCRDEAPLKSGSPCCRAPELSVPPANAASPATAAAPRQFHRSKVPPAAAVTQADGSRADVYSPFRAEQFPPRTCPAGASRCSPG